MRGGWWGAACRVRGLRQAGFAAGFGCFGSQVDVHDLTEIEIVSRTSPALLCVLLLLLYRLIL